MSFRVMARTVLQLGAELISSDGIAFYELIKNSFDAGSPRATIHVRVRVPHKKLLSLRDRLLNADKGRFSSLKEEFISFIDPGSPDADILEAEVRKARDLETLITIVDFANTIEISDRGQGMSLQHLSDVYLTIGTPFRLLQRKNGGSKAVLGEKGLGRLATMRLGWRLTVRTTLEEDDVWHVLNIDWEDFARTPEAYVEDIVISKPHSEEKTGSVKRGTFITIGRLLHEWTPDRLKEVASKDFSRLTDPFTKSSRYPITLKFNGETIPVPSFNEIVFSLAHAVVDAKYEILPTLRFSGKIDYKFHNREMIFELGEPELVGLTRTNPEVLRSLGPFSMKFYWYNRQLLTAVEGIGDRKAVLTIVRDWANGLMIFRDGFRVYPYGGPDDDWLDLDEKAFGFGGYKVNRHQIIGKVDISANKNPRLGDQTNREGLRNTEELQALVSILQHLMWREFKVFLEAVKKELAPNITLDELAPRVGEHRKIIRTAVRELVAKYPLLKKENEVLELINTSLEQITGLMKQAQELADLYENRRSELVHLAGLGLMVEILAHELNRATQHALSVLSELEGKDFPQRANSTLTTLKAQLKTLNTRIRVLDPLSTVGRQRKEKFDLIALVREALESRSGQFERHHIRAKLVAAPGEMPKVFLVTMVPGMVVQVLENLLSNSVYWLKQARKLNPNHTPSIKIVVNPTSRTIEVTDNGPGIAPSLVEKVFEPFFSTKPPGQGKGLGLYISREIAQYHGAELQLSTQHTAHSDRLNTFILSLPTREEP